MGTEILRPQDCLIERMRVVGPQVLSRRRSYANPNPKNNFRKNQQQEQKKRVSSSATESKPVKNNNNGNIVMGHVTILKRGESLDALKRNDQTTSTTTTSPKKKDVDLIVVGTERLGPDPELVPRQIRITDLKLISSSPPRSAPDHVYAGSAFAMSPSPSSLPLPSFYKKKEAVVVVDDSATKDLRRLLRLDA